MRFGSEVAPALPRASQKRLSGSSGKCLVQTRSCSVVLQWQRQSGGSQLLPPAGFLLSLQVCGGKVTPNLSLEL